MLKVLVMTAERLERRAARFNGRTTVYTNTSISRAGMRGISVREKSQPNSQPKLILVTVDRDSRFPSVGIDSVHLGTVMFNPFPKLILNGWSHTLEVTHSMSRVQFSCIKGSIASMRREGLFGGGRMSLSKHSCLLTRNFEARAGFVVK